MKQAFQAILVIVAGVVLGSCGGNSGSSSTTTQVPVASAAKRAFVVNQFQSVVDVVDSQHDIGVFKTMSVNGPANDIWVTSTKKSVVHSTSGSVVLIDNASETTLGTVNNFPGTTTESIVVSPDGLFAYGAVAILGKVYQMDLTTTVETAIPADTATPALLPGVKRLAISHDGKTILTFSDNSDTVSFIDRSNANVISAQVAGFDRPYTAVFSTDDSTAYVLNCGKECGGTAAGVAVVNMATKAITRTVPVRAATVALLDSSNLYVAGTDVVANQGRIDVMNTSTFATVLAGTISDGLHTKMALAANNKLYVGSKACSNSGGQCLSVWTTTAAAGTAAIITGTTQNPVPAGDVTAITPITGRSVVYIIQNGQLVIYDTATDLPQATQIFISGKVVDVKEVDN